LGIVKKALSPLDKLASAAQRLHIHNLHEPLPRTGNGDEVDRLTEVLNATNARLEDSFNRIHEFTLHASHELKTPMAVMHGEIETALADPAATPAQREAFAIRLKWIQPMCGFI
jgi:signal transduction histidine kinase